MEQKWRWRDHLRGILLAALCSSPSFTVVAKEIHSFGPEQSHRWCMTAVAYVNGKPERQIHCFTSPAQQQASYLDTLEVLARILDVWRQGSAQALTQPIIDFENEPSPERWSLVLKRLKLTAELIDVAAELAAYAMRQSPERSQLAAIRERLSKWSDGIADGLSLPEMPDEKSFPIWYLAYHSILVGVQADLDALSQGHPRRDDWFDDRFRLPLYGNLVDAKAAYPEDHSGFGLNIRTQDESWVRATAPGTVLYVGTEVSNYGLAIIVKHEDGFVSIYGNLAKAFVKAGEEIHDHEVVGLSASSACSMTPVRFELRHGQTLIDASRHLPAMP